MSDHEDQEFKYKPVFPGLMSSLKSFISSKAKDLKFGTSNSVTEVPYLIIDSIESSVAHDGGMFDPRQGLLHNCELGLKLYVQESMIEKYYDIIINLLHAWVASSGFVDIKILRRTLYSVREEMNEYMIVVSCVITYYDYVADTTYPVATEDECALNIDTLSPKTMRVDKVEVITDTII